MYYDPDGVGLIFNLIKVREDLEFLSLIFNETSQKLHASGFSLIKAVCLFQATYQRKLQKNKSFWLFKLAMEWIPYLKSYNFKSLKGYKLSFMSNFNMTGFKQNIKWLSSLKIWQLEWNMSSIMSKSSNIEKNFSPEQLCQIGCFLIAKTMSLKAMCLWLKAKLLMKFAWRPLIKPIPIKFFLILFHSKFTINWEYWKTTKQPLLKFRLRFRQFYLILMKKPT